jgi:hypothetical protein
MDKKEIEKLIEIEKKKLSDFMVLFELYKFTDEQKDELINFSLDRIIELNKKLKKIKH